MTRYCGICANPRSKSGGHVELRGTLDIGAQRADEIEGPAVDITAHCCSRCANELMETGGTYIQMYVKNFRVRSNK